MVKKLIAAIDPGATTGIAIARLWVPNRVAYLERVCITSTDDPYEVLQLVNINKCEHVVIERRPANADTGNPVVVVYDTILVKLIGMGYKEHNHFKLKDKTVSTITPGLWKPVMRDKMVGGGVWNMTDAHQHDAVGLLHYTVMLNHMGKEINYG